MARYLPFKKRTFRLKREARSWAEKQKRESKGAGVALKIETNYLPNDGMWEAIVLRKEE